MYASVSEANNISEPHDNISRMISDIDLKVQNFLLPRFLRFMGPNINKLPDIDETHLVPVQWMPGYVAVSGYTEVNRLNNYSSDDINNDNCGTEGPILSFGYFPMDVSSAIPVLLLQSVMETLCCDKTTAPVRLLDLCCCPGGKFFSLADVVRRLPHSNLSSMVQLIGVDISNSRIATMKSLYTKVQTWRSGLPSNQNSAVVDPVHMQIYEADGTVFSQCKKEDDVAASSGRLVFDSNVFNAELLHRQGGGVSRSSSADPDCVGKRQKLDTSSSTLKSTNDGSVPVHRKRMNKSAKGRIEKLLKQVQSEGEGVRDGTFDVVLVDAQCTHDGSYRHIKPTNAAVAKLAVVDCGDTSSSTHSILHDSIISSVPSQPFTVSKVDQKHDSIREYLQKREPGLKKNGNLASSSTVEYGDDIPSSTEMNTLYKLQRDLICNGFQQLKAGGVLVYSTCSKDVGQNEAIVMHLLNQCPNAVLLPISSGQDDRNEAENDKGTDWLGDLLAATEPRPISSLNMHDVLALDDEDFAKLSRYYAQFGSSGSTSTEFLVSSSAKQFREYPYLVELSDRICEFVACQRSDEADNSNRVPATPAPPWCNSSVLPGTVSVGRRYAGVSGLFIAKIKKQGSV